MQAAAGAAPHLNPLPDREEVRLPAPPPLGRAGGLYRRLRGGGRSGAQLRHLGACPPSIPPKEGRFKGPPGERPEGTGASRLAPTEAYPAPLPWCAAPDRLLELALRLLAQRQHGQRDPRLAEAVALLTGVFAAHASGLTTLWPTTYRHPVTPPLPCRGDSCGRPSPPAFPPLWGKLKEGARRQARRRGRVARGAPPSTEPAPPLPQPSPRWGNFLKPPSLYGRD